jgi:hypothetical protein
VQQTRVFGTFYNDFAINYEFFKRKVFTKNHLLTGKPETSSFFIFAPGILLFEAKSK